MADETEKIVLNHSGDHHQAEVTIDAEKQKVYGGTILNFSNNAQMGINFDEKGKASGNFAHTGDTHSLMANVGQDGSFKGTFIEKKSGVTLSLASGLASLQKGTIPPTGLTIEADHHKVDLQVDGKGRISGSFESKVTEESSFKVDVKNGRVVGGTFQHMGEKHATTVSVEKDKWKATVASGGWSINIDQGKSTKISGNLKARF